MAKKPSFPTVTKRTRKKPEILEYEFDKNYWDKWDIDWHNDAVVEDKTNDDREAKAFTSDCFYRAKNSKGPWIYAYSTVNIRGNAKYPLIGGPLNGQRGTIMGSDDYVAYNCAANSRGGSKKSKTWPTNVLVHSSLIEKFN